MFCSSYALIADPALRHLPRMNWRLGLDMGASGDKSLHCLHFVSEIGYIKALDEGEVHKHKI